MDDVRVWNDVRSVTEIADNMDRQLNGDEANLAGYWKFNSVSGSTVTDDSPNSNDATLQGDASLEDQLNVNMSQGTLLHFNLEFKNSSGTSLGTGFIEFDDPGDGTHLLKDLTSLSYDFNVGAKNWNNDAVNGNPLTAYDFANPTSRQSPDNDSIIISTVNGVREFAWLDAQTSSSQPGDSTGIRVDFNQNNQTLGFRETDNYFHNNSSNHNNQTWEITSVTKPSVFKGLILGTDPNGDALSYGNATSPTNGTISLSAHGAYNYSNDGTTGSDSFNADVEDGTNTTTVNIDITVT